MDTNNYFDILPNHLQDYILKWKEFYECEEDWKDRNQWYIDRAVAMKRRLGLITTDQEAYDEGWSYYDQGFDFDGYYGHEGYMKKY